MPLVGNDYPSEGQKCTLEVARVICEDFLKQNVFTEHDVVCPFAKTMGMMQVIEFSTEQQENNG